MKEMQRGDNDWDKAGAALDMVLKDISICLTSLCRFSTNLEFKKKCDTDHWPARTPHHSCCPLHFHMRSLFPYIHIPLVRHPNKSYVKEWTSHLTQEHHITLPMGTSDLTQAHDITLPMGTSDLTRAHHITLPMGTSDLTQAHDITLPMGTSDLTQAHHITLPTSHRHMASHFPWAQHIDHTSHGHIRPHTGT